MAENEKLSLPLHTDELILAALDRETKAKRWEERAHYKYQRLVSPAVVEACAEITREARMAGAQEGEAALALIKCHTTLLRMILANAVLAIRADKRALMWKMLAKYSNDVANEHVEDYLKTMAEELDND